MTNLIAQILQQVESPNTGKLAKMINGKEQLLSGKNAAKWKELLKKYPELKKALEKGTANKQILSGKKSKWDNVLLNPDNKNLLLVPSSLADIIAKLKADQNIKEEINQVIRKAKKKSEKASTTSVNSSGSTDANKTNVNIKKISARIKQAEKNIKAGKKPVVTELQSDKTGKIDNKVKVLKDEAKVGISKAANPGKKLSLGLEESEYQKITQQKTPDENTINSAKSVKIGASEIKKGVTEEVKSLNSKITSEGSKLKSAKKTIQAQNTVKTESPKSQNGAKASKKGDNKKSNDAPVVEFNIEKGKTKITTDISVDTKTTADGRSSIKKTLSENDNYLQSQSKIEAKSKNVRGHKSEVEFKTAEKIAKNGDSIKEVADHIRKHIDNGIKKVKSTSTSGNKPTDKAELTQTHQKSSQQEAKTIEVSAKSKNTEIQQKSNQDIKEITVKSNDRSIKDINQRNSNNQNQSNDNNANSFAKAVNYQNIEMVRQHLPAKLVQVIQKEISTSKNLQMEQWQQHKFVMDDGKSINVALKQNGGILHLQIGSQNADMSKLLQQQMQDIRMHLQEHFNMEIDLQFQNSGQQGQNTGKESNGQMGNNNHGQVTSIGGSEISDSISTLSGNRQGVRFLGFNRNEWTA